MKGVELANGPVRFTTPLHGKMGSELLLIAFGIK